MDLLLINSNLVRCRACRFVINWIRSLTMSLLLKLPETKLEPSFLLWSFFLVTLVFISLNMSYNLAWDTASLYELVLLVAIWISRISYRSKYVGLWAASVEPLAHHLNIFSLSVFYRYYFGRCSSELAELSPLHFSFGRSFHYSLF